MYFNLIQLIVIITFFNCTLLSVKKKKNLLLLWIMIICFATELLSFLLLLSHHKINLLYSIIFIVHNGIWLLILIQKIISQKNIILFFSLYLLLCIFNIAFIEGLKKVNFNIFIFGSLIYLILFISFCYKKLKVEDLTFFQSNDFLLICIPLLFFSGLSLLFSFKSNSLNNILIFNKINLYKFLIYFVNIIYYSLINVYIHYERKNINLNNA